MVQSQNIVYILLGGNIGNVEVTFSDAKIELENKVGNIAKESEIYKSKAWGFESSSDFLNQVIEIHSSLSPRDLLRETLLIESHLGRVRNSNNNGFTSRVIDIDILYYNSEIINETGLIVPHYAIQERLFTLRPLVDLNPHFLHPQLGKTNKELLLMCSDKNIPEKL